METGNPADTRTAQRVAVVGQFQGDEASLISRLLRGRGLLPVLQRDLQRDLDRRRSVIRKEDVPQSMRREIDQPLGQPDRRGVRHAQRGDVGNLVQLLPDCRIDLGPPMSVDVAPEATDSIQVAAALHIDQPVPLAPFDDPGLVFRHLREAVPDMLPVPLPQLIDAGIHAAHREIGIEEDRKMRAAAGRRSERGPVLNPAQGHLPPDRHGAARPDAQKGADAVADQLQPDEPVLAKHGQKRHLRLLMVGWKQAVRDVVFTGDRHPLIGRHVLQASDLDIGDGVPRLADRDNLAVHCPRQDQISCRWCKPTL